MNAPPNGMTLGTTSRGVAAIALATKAARPLPASEAQPGHTTRNIHFYDENLNDDSETVIEDRFL